MRRSRKFEEELAVRKRPAAPVDEAAEEHGGLADEALRLQELVGNTNTNAVIARSALQRDETATKADPTKGGEKAGSMYTMTMSDIGSFELLSLAWGQSKPVGPTGPSEKEQEEKHHYSDLTATRKQDALSPKLMQYAAEGRKIDTVEIVIKGGTGTMTATLKNVYISGFQIGGDDGGGSAIDSFTLTFDTMEWKFPEGSK
jgi:type VI protein secretion system component Hcp